MDIHFKSSLIMSTLTRYKILEYVDLYLYSFFFNLFGVILLAFIDWCLHKFFVWFLFTDLLVDTFVLFLGSVLK